MDLRYALTLLFLEGKLRKRRDLNESFVNG